MEVFYLENFLYVCTTARIEVNVLVAPDTAYWTAGAGTSDWNDVDNWTSLVVSGGCTDVIIQTSTLYPDISAEEEIFIYNIILEPRLQFLV